MALAGSGDPPGPGKNVTSAAAVLHRPTQHPVEAESAPRPRVPLFALLESNVSLPSAVSHGTD